MFIFSLEFVGKQEEFSSSNLPNFDSNKGKMSSVGTLLPFNNVPGGGGGGGVGGAGGVGGGITSVGGTTQSYLVSPFIPFYIDFYYSILSNLTPTANILET